MDARIALLAALVAAATPEGALAQPDPAPAPAAPPEAGPPTPVPPVEAEPPAGVRPPARVEGSAPPAAPGAAPRWSLGAGVGAMSGIFLVGPPSFLPTGVPVATAFVERRVGERTWLVFNFSGRVTRDMEEVTWETASAEGDGDVLLASASAGLRRAVTPPGAPVEVSLFGMVGGGYQRVRDWTEPTATIRVLDEETGTFASVSGGLALERALTEALALRISTTIVEAWRSRLEGDDEVVSREYDSTGVAITLAPRLELRLAF